MKSILTVFALVACLGGPALAEEASRPAQAPAAAEPQAQAVLPAALPHSTAPAQDPAALPASMPPPDAATARGRGGGCGHEAETVYLTN